MQRRLNTQKIEDATIMVVDDSATASENLRRFLHRAGFTNCVTFTDHESALANFFDINPDVLVLDWHLGEFQGDAFLQRLLSDLDGREMPPVLVVTGDMKPQLRIRALSMGASDFLTKPFDPPEVILRIRNLLQTRLLYLCIKAENTQLEETVERSTSQLNQSLAKLNELQNQLIQHERLRALGAMATGIAHDFNNALMMIMGFSAAFKNESEILLDPARSLECFQTIQNAASDATSIVQRLVEFSRPYHNHDEPRCLVDINEIIDSIIHMTRPKWDSAAKTNGAKIEVVKHLEAIPPIFASATELREVFVNLIFNAVDAMPQGGCVTISTEAQDENVVIHVEDTGTGMSETTRQRCMEPFYTTKGTKGTGLGLAIIYGIVKRHQGSIRILSNSGSGTRFSIALPFDAEAMKNGQTPADVLDATDDDADDDALPSVG
jgi:signal transduction histidine kinase